jgi:regulatory protein
MPVVTAVETQKHDPERVNVYLDGQFAFGASALVVASRHLREGRDLSPEEVESLKQDDAVERAYGAALNFLSYRPRSRREIADYFRRKKIEPEIGEAVLTRLERLGLVDDAEFARFWVENRQSFRPRGSRALRVELRQKGIAGETIDAALSDLGDEVETAREAGRKKLRTLGRLDDREFHTRMVAFLQRRGFTYAAAAHAARDLAQERGVANVEIPLEEEIPGE